MGKKVYFLDSVMQSDGSYDNTYGVDDVNAIVCNLVGTGVAPFPSGDTYDVSELNSLTSALVAEGTSLDGLKVSFSDNKIHIAQGIGYFENGATIVVDADGEELDYNVAEILYVYAEYNQALNTCGFYASENEPKQDTGIYTLMLGTITADGTVEDKRTFAQSKIATLGRNVMENHIILDLSGTAENYRTWYASYSDQIIWEKSLNLSQFNAIVIDWEMYGDATHKIPLQLIKLENGSLSEQNIYYARYSGNTYYHMAIRYKDGKLQIFVPASDQSYSRMMHLYDLAITIY